MQKIGEGREAEIFALDDGRVLRLMRDPGSREWAEMQAAALMAARRAGCPVPEVGELVEEDGRPGLIMQRIDGPDLLAVVEKRPWKIFDLAALTGRTHSAINEVVAPPELPSLKARLQLFISAARLPSRLQDFALETLETLPDGERLCHGDFHPGNILLSAEGPVVIDWTNASRGDPVADVARTRTLFNFGALPPGTSLMLTMLAKLGRRLFARLYFRGYRKITPLDFETIKQWEIPHAAARVAEGIPGEAEHLVAFLDQSLSNSAATRVRYR